MDLPQCLHFSPVVRTFVFCLIFIYCGLCPHLRISLTRTALKGCDIPIVTESCNALFHNPSFFISSYLSACLAYSCILRLLVIDFGPPERRAMERATTSGEVTIAAHLSHDNSLFLCQ